MEVVRSMDFIVSHILTKVVKKSVFTFSSKTNPFSICRNGDRFFFNTPDHENCKISFIWVDSFTFKDFIFKCNLHTWHFTCIFYSFFLLTFLHFARNWIWRDFKFIVLSSHNSHWIHCLAIVFLNLFTYQHKECLRNKGQGEKKLKPISTP